MKRITIHDVKYWAGEQNWLLVKELMGATFDGMITYVCPSGNIVNFTFNSAGECIDVYEGRRQGT
jgi:hypothetical protein